MNNNKLETQAKEILEIGEKIYKLQKVRNPHAILSDDENLLETEKPQDLEKYLNQIK